MSETVNGRGNELKQVKREYLNMEKWWLFCCGHPERGKPVVEARP